MPATTARQRNRKRKILVYIVESNILAQRYIVQLLSRDRNIVVRIFTSEEKHQRTPDLLVLVLAQGFASGAARFSRLLRSNPGAKVLVIGPSRPTHGTLLSMLKVGVSGFLDYDGMKTELLPAIRGLSKGHVWIHQDDIARFSPKDSRPTAVPKAWERGFTTQQKRI